MKKIVILMVVAIFSCTAIFAQNAQTGKPTPEGVAKERVAMLKKALAFDEKVEKPAYEAELEYANKVVPAANGGFQVDTKELDAARDAKYKKLLTAEQYTKYMELQKKKK